LDYRSKMPISEQIISGVIRLASCGVMEPGEQLPSVRTLAQALGVNPNTVQKAYRTLEQMGTIYSLPGKGSFLTEGTEARDAHRKQMLEQLAKALKGTLEAGLSQEEILDYCRCTLQETGGTQHD
jgi:GntR family transcriptional regulator